MKIQVVGTALATLLLAGCGSTTSFTAGMETPVKVVNSAASLAQESERDVLKAFAVGLTPLYSPFNAVEFLVCGAAGNGPESVRADLQAFADGLEAVKEVGKKPDDVTYAGYLHKLRQNAAAGIDTASENEAAEALAAKETQRRRLCFALWSADVADTTELKRPGGEGAPPQFIARLLGLDQLFKQVLATGEALTREAAVRRTIEKLSTDFEASGNRLKAKPSTSFGPYVHYDSGTAALADSYNATLLGSSINIRRWYVAQQANQQWTYLAACRNSGKKACFGDPSIQAAANGFVDAVYTYRHLVLVEPAKVNKAIDTAVSASKKSLEGQGIAGWIDGLIRVADSLKDLDNAVDKYHESRQ